MAQMRPDPANVARMIFQRYAKHGGQNIDQQDLYDMCKEMGTELSDEELKKAIDHLDQDKDGTVSFDEFLPWYQLGMKPATLYDVGAEKRAAEEEARLKEVAARKKQEEEEERRKEEEEEAKRRAIIEAHSHMKLMDAAQITLCETHEQQLMHVFEKAPNKGATPGPGAGGSVDC